MILVSLSQLYFICFFKVGVRMCFAQYHFDEDNLISMLVAIFFSFGVYFYFGMFFADVNECLNLTICHNGGECINKVGSYACSCKEGWTGQHCHIGTVISLS